MKKLINGQVVNIESDVLDLFEKAMEGTVTKKSLANKIDIILESETGNLGQIVAAYYATYIKLPYPLYAVEEEIKYATIAVEMQRKLKGVLGYTPKVKVNDTKVTVYSEDGYCIELASDNWAVKVEEHYEDIESTVVSLKDYKVDNLYRFYEWCNQKFLKRETLSNFYSFAVPGVLNACGRKPLIVKWELAKLLQFADIPSEATLMNRHFVDVDSNADYFLDVFWGGEYDENEGHRVMVIDIRKGADKLLSEGKSRKKFQYEVYENDKENGRVQLKASKRRFEPVFNVISSLCNNGEDIDTLSYKGIISDGYIAVEIGDRLYAGTIGGTITEIGMGTSILNMSGSKLYVTKNIKKARGAVREAVYIYDIASDTLKICDVQYGKDGKAL